MEFSSISNWDTQDENEWANFTHRLGVSSPYHLKDKKGALSGVDCMVRVLRHLLRSLSRELSQRLLREHRHKNFLLNLAICSFERGTSTQRQDMQVKRDTVWRRLCVQWLSADGAPSFLEIDQSPLMQGTVWLEPELQAFHESLIKPLGADNFQTPGTLKKYLSDLDAIRTSHSLFAWDMSLHGSSEDMFKEHFQRTHVEGAHGT